MEPLRVGFDAKRLVRNATGLGNYSRTLVSDLSALPEASLDLRLYAPDEGRDDLRRSVPEGPRVHYAYPPGHPSALGKALWRSRGVVRQLLSDGVQVFHGLSGELPLGLRQSGIKSVVTIHDLIFLRHPEYYHPWDRAIYTWKFRQTLRQADRIIAISLQTRRDIAQLGGVDEAAIDVVYQSCHPRFSSVLAPHRLASVRERLSLPQHFFLSVGSIEERKNLMLAVEALPHLPGFLHLVAVGKATPYADKMLRRAQGLGVASRVHLLHGVADDDLQALYQMAEVFVYPSRYEGFGIPIIEAIHCRLPVVAATGSCLEEAGGPDCLYVSPDAPDALADAIVRLRPGAADREERIRRSLLYVQRFQGRSVAAQVADIYRQLGDKKS